MKTLEEFYTEIQVSKDLESEFLNSCRENKLMDFLEKHGCKVEEEELKVHL